MVAARYNLSLFTHLTTSISFNANSACILNDTNIAVNLSNNFYTRLLILQAPFINKVKSMSVIALSFV